MDEHSSICDICKQEPQPFFVGDGDGMEEIGYYNVVPKEDTEDNPVFLMSDGAFKFKIAVTKYHPILAEELHICSRCFEILYPDMPTAEEE